MHFFVAFKIPNLLRRLFTEGAVSHALIPMLASFKQNGDQNALKHFISKAAGTLIAWATLLTVIATVLAPLIVFGLAPGFAGQEPQFDIAVELLQITLPYGLCMAIVAFSGALLNAHNHYFIPALTPAFLNICMIAAAVWLAPILTSPITALAWGVIAAGAVQVMIQIPGLWRLGLLPKLTIKRKDPDVSRLKPFATTSNFQRIHNANQSSTRFTGRIFLAYRQRILALLFRPLGRISTGYFGHRPVYCHFA